MASVELTSNSPDVSETFQQVMDLAKQVQEKIAMRPAD